MWYLWQYRQKSPENISKFSPAHLLSALHLVLFLTRISPVWFVTGNSSRSLNDKHFPINRHLIGLHHQLLTHTLKNTTHNCNYRVKWLIKAKHLHSFKFNSIPANGQIVEEVADGIEISYGLVGNKGILETDSTSSTWFSVSILIVAEVWQLWGDRISDARRRSRILTLTMASCGRRGHHHPS